MVVDAVLEVLSVAETNVEPPPSLLGAAESSFAPGQGDFVTGIARNDEQLIILVDLNRVLNIEQ
jgi:chemotaxis signal transduction protein